MPLNAELMVQWARGAQQKARNDGIRVERFICAPDAELMLYEHHMTKGFRTEDFEVIGRQVILAGVPLNSTTKLKPGRILVVLDCRPSDQTN